MIRTIRSLLRHKDVGGLMETCRQHPYLFHVKRRYAWPLMHHCIDRGCVNLAIAKLFYESGGDVNQRANDGTSLLYIAATTTALGDPQKKKTICGFLEAHGATMSPIEEAMATLLIYRGDKLDGVTSLIKKNPGLVHGRGREGWTLLHVALHHNCFAVARFLVESGADCNALTYTGWTPLGCLGVHFSDPATKELFDYLVSHGAKYTEQEELRELIRQNREEEVLKRFRENPRLLNAWEPALWNTYLHVAVGIGSSILIVKYLLEQGVDVNERNYAGESALHVGKERFVEATELLIEYGAHVNVRDYRGVTPLHKAVWNGEETVRLLIEAGADINAKDYDGATPIDVADRIGVVELTELSA